MAKATATKHKGIENKAYFEGMQRLRGGNAAQPHDSRTNRQRQRGQAKGHAIREQRG